LRGDGKIARLAEGMSEQPAEDAFWSD